MRRKFSWLVWSSSPSCAFAFSLLLHAAWEETVRPRFFLDTQNDSTEGRKALFRFSNSTPVLVGRWYFYEIQFQTATGWTSQGTWSFPTFATQPLLRPRESEVVAVSAPDTQSKWRLGFPTCSTKAQFTVLPETPF